MRGASRSNFASYPLSFIVAGFAAATILWFVMFSPWTAPSVNFWVMMSISAAVLTTFSILVRRKELRAALSIASRDLMTGLVTAFLLYAVFYLGNEISRAILPFAGEEIGGVYATRDQGSPFLIGILLLLLIGPAEEIFWRGFAQEQLMQKFGSWKGFLVTTGVYTLVHLPSWNLMLIGAALIAGAFWGVMYLKLRRLVPCIISHAVWDCVIFVVLPITG